MSGTSVASAGIQVGMPSLSGSGACKSCVDDDKCWTDPRVRTAEDVVSVCRMAHGIFFLAYALLLLIVIILVWLTSNGSISSEVNAATTTAICAIVIVLLAMHMGLYVKGVIPECCNTDCNPYRSQMPASSSGAGVALTLGATSAATAR
jgi:uncharacterized integral membrane protein